MYNECAKTVPNNYNKTHKIRDRINNEIIQHTHTDPLRKNTTEQQDQRQQTRPPQHPHAQTQTHIVAQFVFHFPI